MTREELFLKIDELNIPKDFYSIQGRLAQVNLDKYSDGTWRVFIMVDQGEYINDDTFIYEEQAYDYFYSLLVKEFSDMTGKK